VLRYYRKGRELIAHPVVVRLRRAARIGVVTCAVILAVAIVTTVTVDLGPAAKQSAETYGSQFIERPMRIGRLSFRLFTGRFLIEDLLIEGLTHESRPFLTAKRIEVTMPWSTLINRRVVLDSIEMTDWDMYLEVRDGKHSLPRLTPRTASTGPRRVTTTLQWVRAWRGQFTYEDHGTPWSIVTRNLDVLVAKPGSEYRGQASFSNGTVAIQDYVPFRADMRSTFKIDGSRVLLDKIDLITDGARSSVYGDVNLAFFPEMMYRVESTFDFNRMRQLFFARETFNLSGTGHFSGNFHLFKEPLPDGTNRTGRELSGTFRSDVAGINEYRFDGLNGTVRWTPDRLLVSDARAGVFGGRAEFGYDMAPLGVRDVRAQARLDARFRGASLMSVSEFFELEGLRLAGAASGNVLLEWPLGRYSAERRMRGRVQVTPPGDVTLMTKRVPTELIEEGRLPRGPAAPLAPLIPLPVGADLTFDIGPKTIRLAPGHLATQRTYVELEGETTNDGLNSTIPFSVSSADWSESYRVFAQVLTALGSRTTTQNIGGYGTFDGTLHGDLRRPRIEGSFAGERMRAWDVEWGSARGRVSIENSYADLRETSVTRGDSTIEADGRFSLGFPRRDGGEEINASVRLSKRPVADLRHAFGLDSYPIDGLLTGEFHVFGEYRRPLGYGTVALADPVAYGEPVDGLTATVSLEGKGIRLTKIDMVKGGGRGSGSAYVDWDGGYSFSFSSDRTAAIPVESVQISSRSPLPLSGLIDFDAFGSGTFDNPSYTVRGTVRDLFAADEGIGQVNVKNLVVANDTMTIDVEVASPRLDVDVLGRVDLASGMYADVTFTVNETSLDPYVRVLDPRLSPFTTAVVSGRVNVKGELSKPDALAIAATVSQLQLQLFDYKLQNEGEFDIAFGENYIGIPREKPLFLFGEDTKLQIFGAVGLGDNSITMSLGGQANLAVLQGFDPNIRSSGNAQLSAVMSGTREQPVLEGTLRIDNGRFRHFAFPLALERMNGPIAFDSRGLSVDGLTAELGGGQVRFEGTVAPEGFLPGEINITMSGENILVRYPLDMRSRLDIPRLTLTGTPRDMRLEGEVVVIDALYSRPFPADIIALLTSAVGSSPEAPPSDAEPLPLRYDGVVIRAQSSVRVQNSGTFSARLTSSANLELRGTAAQPVLSGDLELDRGGELTLFGKRYTIAQGTVYFSNPSRIEPTFDIEAETRVRVPGETYRITANVRGGLNRFERPTFTSDPPLTDPEIYALLISDVPPGQDLELRQARGDSAAEQQLLRELAAQAATGAISAQFNRAVEQTLGVNFSITPTLTDPDQQSSRAEPGARFLVGRRIGQNVYFQYSRSLSATNRDEIILIEYYPSDRLTWVVSRNEDQTYAIEVRMRRSF
jgi:hypothetical protein